jgi:hypothetical protein
MKLLLLTAAYVAVICLVVSVVFFAPGCRGAYIAGWFLSGSPDIKSGISATAPP